MQSIYVIDEKFNKVNANKLLSRCSALFKFVSELLRTQFTPTIDG